MRFIFFTFLFIQSVLLSGQDKSLILSQKDKDLYKFTQYISSKKLTDLKEIVDKLLTHAEREEDTVKLFYLWIADNIAYDTKSFLSNDVKIYSAEEIIKRKKAVCSGYSLVFQEMCNYVGIICYAVDGYAKGYGYKQGSKFKQSDHAWNVIYINNKWKLLDATWGAGYVETKNSKLKFTKQLNMTYFYTTPETFIQKHLPADPTWQLLNHIVGIKKFVKYEKPNDMISHAQKEYFNFNDSIARLDMLYNDEKNIKRAENEYHFFPGDPNNLIINYYNYGITLSQDNTNKENLKKALIYFNKAKDTYLNSKITNSKDILSSIKQGIEYVNFYLK